MMKYITQQELDSCLFLVFFCFLYWSVEGCCKGCFLYLEVLVSMVLQYFLEGSRRETSRMWEVSDVLSARILDLDSYRSQWFCHPSAQYAKSCADHVLWTFFTCTCCVMLVVKSVIHLQLASGMVSWAWPVKLWYYVVKRRLRMDH